MMADAGTTEKHVHVLIIGAGLTGLLIAHGLKKAGTKFSIFESEPSITYYWPREWSMGIHWSLPQLEALLPSELRARLKEAQNDPFWDAPEEDFFKLYNGLDGTILKALPIPKTIRVSRRKMRALCSEGIDVQYGFELINITYSSDQKEVTATFSNGESVTGSLIIKADGPRSKVRELLMGPEKGAVTPMGIVHSNVAAVYHDAEKAKFIRSAHPSFSCMAHPELLSFIASEFFPHSFRHHAYEYLVQDVPDEHDPATWCFQVVTSWLGSLDPNLDSAARLAQIKEKASVLAEPFRSAIQWMPGDTKITYNSIAYWAPVPWDSHSGRVTLAGDAAHPMPPHRGQGLNHAICDSSNLVAAVQRVVDGPKTLEVLIKECSEEVVKRGAIEVQVSRETALAFLDWDKLMGSPLMKKSLGRSDS